MLNKKALAIFLILTFGLTIGLVLIARFSGLTLFDAPVLVSQLVIAAAMFIPALSALIVQKLILKKSFKSLGITWGPWKMYLKTYGIIFLLFLINYLITWLFITKPDLSLISFLQQYNITAPLPMPAATMIMLFVLMTLVAAPIFNMIPSLGEEIGWRGFLLPQLEPLGKIKAVIISGIIWALWHTPMIIILGFVYGRQIWPGVLMHFITVTSLGIWFGYIWLKTHSTVQAAFMHATFNAHAYGFWVIIFVSSNKLLIGAVGLIGMLLALILAYMTIYKMRQETAHLMNRPTE